jgi:pilus assembly protein Flp/PilA
MKNISDFFLALYVRVVTAVRSEKGQTLVEYALILVLIAIVVIAALTLTGQKVNNAFSNIANKLGQ